MFALIDCNNFYVACERLFRPDLAHRPVVVLSNNDGCIIARSNEAKTLGIAMGSPYFKVRRCCETHQVAVFSSNYTLYGDMSHRVMRLIKEYWPKVECYSIDEAFLDLRGLPENTTESTMHGLHGLILKGIGIPTSIGMGKTKTLAKAANRIAKGVLKIPVYQFNTENQEHWLKQIEVSELWGVGNRLGKKLHALGIATAYDLAKCDPHGIRRQFSVVLMRTVLELQGIVCQELTLSAPKQSITVSRSFGSLQTCYPALSEALSVHTHAAWVKLRKEQLVTSEIRVFIESSAFEKTTPYHAEVSFVLAVPTDDVRLLTHGAQVCLRRLFKPTVSYQKCGVTLLDLSAPSIQQRELFPSQSLKDQLKTERLLQTIETINQRFGKQTLHVASLGFNHRWEMKRDYQSPHYTTCWKQLAQVVAR